MLVFHHLASERHPTSVDDFTMTDYHVGLFHKMPLYPKNNNKSPISNNTPISVTHAKMRLLTQQFRAEALKDDSCVSEMQIF